ncbi:MAG: GNAT family N-acetyltransferase [Bacteroidota bacterium]
MPTLRILPATTAAHYAIARPLIEAYAAWLGEDLCYQDFDRELETLAKRYGPPSGALLLAYLEEEPVGTVALRALAEPGACEMKRLFVQPAARGHGLGRRLAEGIVAAGQDLGYTVMRLDTLGRLTAALTLYADLGFRETPSYYANPLPDVHYLALDLTGPG